MNYNFNIISLKVKLTFEKILKLHYGLLVIWGPIQIGFNPVVEYV